MVWDVSAVRLSHCPDEIARRAGLAPAPDVFVAINAKLAAQILAYVQSESLAHGRKRYRETYFREAKAMLAELGDDAKFWSNSSYEGYFQAGPEPSAWGYKPLTSNVLDTGIAGCSASEA